MTPSPMSSAQPVALVTGSSSGLGAALAEALAANGFRVIGVGRNRPAGTPETEFITTDLARPDAAATVAAELQKRTARLDLLVNNAGFGGYAVWEELPEADLRRMFEVDFFAPVALTGALLAMLKASHGAIVDIASVAAKVPVPCMGAYCAAKAALAQYSETLHAELEPHGVTVLTVYPGRISTGFSSRAIRLRECPETPGTRIDPAVFARRVLRRLHRRRRAFIFPGWYRFFIAFARLFPNVYDRCARRVWKLR